MKKITITLISLFAFFAMQLNAQICNPPCTPDPACVEVDNPGEVCPIDLPTANVGEYYSETVTVIPPAEYGGWPVITQIRIDDVQGLPEGLTWCKSQELFVVTEPYTRYCCQLSGTPTIVGEYQLTLLITPYIGFGGISVPQAQVTDDTSLVVIVLPAAPDAAFTANPTTAPTGTPITFTDNSTNNPTSWIWTFEGGTPPTSTLQNPTVTFAAQGIYDVTLIVANEGGSDELTKQDYITIDNGTGVSESMYQKVKIYPNPASRQITVEAEDLISVSILDMLGKVVLSVNANSTTEVIDISGLGKANYFVKITTAAGEITKSISIK
ncbi:MAG: T9SS type A sorting domain-containing protein [Bacteroidales bacterium]|nr:T9SS type A sorting domain-containing protein [Bacteroidales bacterium]